MVTTTRQTRGCCWDLGESAPSRCEVAEISTTAELPVTDSTAASLTVALVTIFSSCNALTKSSADYSKLERNRPVDPSMTRWTVSLAVV